MKELLAQHGVQASVVLVLAIFNIALTAVKSGVDKLEDYLSSKPEKLEGIKGWSVKALGWSSGIIDWLTGNKEH